jgi:endonuclease YncB( thermonuclease family)
MWLIRLALAIFAILAALLFRSAEASDRLPGPYFAEVERVVDGDTLAVRVAIWIGQDLNVLVRIRGIDAPEIRGKCLREKEQAREATLALQRLVASGDVSLSTIEGDKYFGRVIADVENRHGENVGEALLGSGFVRAYDGSARQGWCGVDGSDRAPELTGSVSPPMD